MSNIEIPNHWLKWQMWSKILYHGTHYTRAGPTRRKKKHFKIYFLNCLVYEKELKEKKNCNIEFQRHGSTWEIVVMTIL